MRNQPDIVAAAQRDAADAAAIAEAVLRPNMYCVAVKGAGHQARDVVFRIHQCFVCLRTQLINVLRGHLAEFGLVFPQGPTRLKHAAALQVDETTEIPDIRQGDGSILT